MTVFTIYNGDARGYTVATLDGVDWSETEGLEIGEEIKIVVGEMSQEAYDALPEFAGY